MLRLWFAMWLMCGILSVSFSPARAQQLALERTLKAEGMDELTAAARQIRHGARGAVVFHQPHMSCAKCHAVDGTPNGLGPDLTAFPRETSHGQLVESRLEPSHATT